MPRRRVSTNTKTTTTGGAAGVVLAYAAGLASQKWAIPLEVTSVIAGGAFSFIARWAGKLIPDA